MIVNAPPPELTLNADLHLPPNTGADKYLELLKRSLADLLVPQMRGYARIHTLLPEAEERVAQDPSFREGLAYGARVMGWDWPESAVTMIGYAGLSYLQLCVERILEDEVPGDVIETGVWRGGACIFLREALGEDARRVWAVDSFAGFDPEDPDSEGFVEPYLCVSVRDVKRNFERFGVPTDSVVFLEGFFRETLPTLREEEWSLLHLDGDTYEATQLALEHLYPQLSPGGFVLVDDYGSVEGCKQAVDQFIPDDLLVHLDATTACWRKPR